MCSADIRPLECWPADVNPLNPQFAWFHSLGSAFKTGKKCDCDHQILFEDGSANCLSSERRGDWFGHYWERKVSDSN
jgi:hypothetical protein